MDSEELDLKLLTKIQSEGVTKNKVYSPEALKALRAEPVKTAWGWNQGRPIYNRLPMVAEAYQKGYDKDQAMVYLDPTVPIANGPGTLEVKRDERNWGVIDIQGGVISWEHGELSIDRTRIDVSSLNEDRGLVDGEYQIGYRLQHVSDRGIRRFEGFEVAQANSRSMSSQKITFDSSGDTSDHRGAYALTDFQEQSWWPNYYYGAGGYRSGTHFTLDFYEPTYSNQFQIRGDEGKTSSSLAYYSSDDAIIWYKKEQVNSQNNVWTIDAQDVAQYRRFYFWDGTTSINNITYSGDGYFRDNRFIKTDSQSDLFIENMYDAIEGNYILLAGITVKDRVIQQIRDLRRVTYERYQPVADWVTTFHDEQLRCHFDDVVEYAKLWMNPTSGDRQIYYEMDDTSCWGLGEISIGFEDDVPFISYPTEVALYGQQTDISPSEVNWIPEPVMAGDLATPPYAQKTLQDWSLDNGNY